MRRLLIFSLGVGTIAMTSPLRNAHRTAKPRETFTQSVWDSVYTDSQSVRGDAAYKQACAKCHGATLTGTDSAVTLSGKDFLTNWDGLTLDQLYDKILTTMPSDNPKSLPRAQVSDILAYMLAQNQFPAGHKPLTDDMTQLKDIKFEKNKP